MTTLGHRSTQGKALQRPDLATIRRFLSYVVVQGLDAGCTRCWRWTGYTRSDDHAKETPYGQFNIKDPDTGAWTTRHAHRVSYAIFHEGGLPAGVDVDHKCGNHRCVNPEHLRLLTRRDNVAASNAARTSTPIEEPDATPF